MARSHFSKVQLGYPFSYSNATSGPMSSMLNIKMMSTINPGKIYIFLFFRSMQICLHYPGGHSHKLGYAYTRTARVWFLAISVIERGVLKCVLMSPAVMVCT